MKFLSQICDFMFAPAGTFDSDSVSSNASDDSFIEHEFPVINPADGLPMINNDIGGVDIMGSPFGMDIHHHDDFTCASDSNVFSHDDCGSMFDHGSCSMDTSSTFDTGLSFDSGSMFD